MKYKVAQIPSVGMMVIEDENGILLSPAEVAGLLNSLEQRLAAAEAKNTELEKELFVLSSDVIYFENQTLPYEIVRKAKRVYDELRRSEGEL